jgi:four helix bundle protein
MFLQLNHQKLDVYQSARTFCKECYKVSKIFPPEERFNMVQQVRRAALSVVLNLAEGCSRKSEAERKRYFEISRGSIIEIDAALDMANDLEYLDNYNHQPLNEATNRTFSMLSKLIAS